jgi:hypothetical protein
MLGGKDDVFRAGFLGDTDPLIGVKAGGVEGGIEVEPFGPLLFGVGGGQGPNEAGMGLGPGAEVDEDAEFGGLPAVELSGRGVLGEPGRGEQETKKEDQES